VSFSAADLQRSPPSPRSQRHRRHRFEQAKDSYNKDFRFLRKGRNAYRSRAMTGDVGDDGDQIFSASPRLKRLGRALFVGRDFLLVRQSHADLVEPFEQAGAAKGIRFEVG
jgi:hypothetical protein